MSPLKIKLLSSGVLATIILFTVVPAKAQTRESGPFWPTEWGSEDQSGASNRITPEKILQSLSIVEKGQLVELGHIYSSDMPILGSRTFTLKLVPEVYARGANGNIGNDEFVAAEIGQVGTQFDGLGHIGAEMVMSDGSIQRVFYNGFTGSEIYSQGGLRELGIEKIKPIITHGVLIDIASYKDVTQLSPNYEITVNDVLGAMAKQGLSESDIQPGDAVLFRTGYGPLWYSDKTTYNGPAPGIGLEVARWMVNHQITVTGADTYSTEISANPDPELFGPVHQELMTKNGVFNIENLYFEELVQKKIYEFLFIATPIRYKGATGSPLRPLALY